MTTKCWTVLTALVLLMTTACSGAVETTDDEAQAGQSDEAGQDVSGGGDQDGGDGQSGPVEAGSADGAEPSNGTEGDDGTEGETTDAPAGPSTTDPVAIAPGTVVRLMVDRSFSASDGIFDAFTLETGIEVDLVRAGDRTALASRTVTAAEGGEADVVFGVDNISIHELVANGSISPYRSSAVDGVAIAGFGQTGDQATPVAFDDVCVMTRAGAVEPPPATLEELASDHAGALAIPDPATSVLGSAFLLATVAAYGDQGWEDYWQRLSDGGTTIASTPGTTAGGPDGAGAGLVVASTMSPIIDVLFAGTSESVESSGGVSGDVVGGSCFRRFELAVVVAGTDRQAAAEALVDYLVAPGFQSDLPLTRFVQPVLADVGLPEGLADLVADIDDPQTLDQDSIAQGIGRWRARSTEILAG